MIHLIEKKVGLMVLYMNGRSIYRTVMLFYYIAVNQLCLVGGRWHMYF